MFYMARKKIKSPVPTSFIIKTQGNTIIFFSEFDSLNRLETTTYYTYIIHIGLVDFIKYLI